MVAKTGSVVGLSTPRAISVAKLSKKFNDTVLIRLETEKSRGARR
jgi:hypothetical protein